MAWIREKLRDFLGGYGNQRRWWQDYGDSFGRGEKS